MILKMISVDYLSIIKNISFLMNPYTNQSDLPSFAHLE